MIFSQRINKEAEKYAIPAQTLVLADLMAIGYTANEAYNIAYAENASLSKQQNISIRDNITATVDFQMLLKDRTERIKSATPSTAPIEVKELYTKEEIASKLRTQIEQLPDGSKEKADVLMKYADLFAMKKEEKRAEEEDIIRVWIPLTCDICPFKKKFEKGENNGTR